MITTAVTDSAVERIDGDRARVLVYADQSSVSTAGTTKGGKQQKAQDQGSTRAPCSPWTSSTGTAAGSSRTSTPSAAEPPSR